MAWLSDRGTIRGPKSPQMYAYWTQFQISIWWRLPHPRRSVSMLDSESIHRRFGHCSEGRLQKMAGRCNGFPKVPAGFSHDPTSCDSCLAGGSKRKPFHKRTSQHFTYFGERLSSDLCGPFPKSIRGCRYAMCIVDSASNYLWVKLLPTKESANVREDTCRWTTSM